jgi:hypothetical protein
MGVVYRAVQESLGREVALKVLSAELGGYDIYVERFREEARILASLDHPHILPVYDLGSADGQIYIAMPLVRGGSVRDQLLGPPLPLELGWKYLSQMADALHHAHEVGLIHRDIKPSNVLVHADGRSVLADFGVARLGGRHLTLSTSGSPVGTPGYMPPEQALNGDLDARADTYALAVTAFELLTGSRPYPGLDHKRLIHATIHDPIPNASRRNRNLPPEVDGVLCRGLAKRPADRPETTLEFITELGRALAPALHLVLVGAGTSALTSMAPAGAQGSGLGTPPPRLRTPPPPAVLHELGMERRRGRNGLLTNSHFATNFQAAMHVAGDSWMDVLEGAGLQIFRWDDPPDDAERGTPVQYLARLCDGFDATFGGESAQFLRQWGRLAAEVELERDRSAGAERRALRVQPGQQRKLAGMLRYLTRRLDEVRGEELHVWKQIDAENFCLAVFSNSHAVTRQKEDKACDYWTAALEANLRWAGLANDWVVSEIECGAVTGSYDCFFAIRNPAALVS